ncbi:RH0 [Bovine atadenovirus D]|uniref:RH0 n=1 Tax=Bovine adenovirus 4 TaxID=70333 RepID=Q77Y96_ADEB4|nr:RH0 [Bovine atadenovirus D]AAQ63167.1 RH0 [Bovine adenovirus 4]
MVLEWRVFEPLAILPVELWSKILLHLSSRDVASFVLSFEELFDVIVTPSFLKHFFKRFFRVSCNKALNCLRADRTLANYEPLDLNSYWCSDRLFLPSGHCIACLTNPHLLCASPSEAGCNCLDHRKLWPGLEEVILWKPGLFQNLEDGWKWPECGVPELSVKKRKRLYKKLLCKLKAEQILRPEFYI